MGGYLVHQGTILEIFQITYLQLLDNVFRPQ